MYDFVISDTHFFHKRIAELAGRPNDWQEQILWKWRSLIQPDDTVLHLGDVLMGQKQLWPTIGYLPGKVTMLNSGNHDEPHKLDYIYDEMGWAIIDEFDMKYRGWDIYFSHRPLWVDYPDSNDNTVVKVTQHGAVHAIHAINVHGHIHEKPAPSMFHINVSVEQTGYKPLRLKDVLDARIGQLENGY
jgi:calcineurin-like phosphoesterase family protein